VRQPAKTNNALAANHFNRLGTPTWPKLAAAREHGKPEWDGR